jgi:hypothetical protein
MKSRATAFCFLAVPLCATVIAITGAVLLPPTAAAGIGFQPVVPDDLKMTAGPQAPGAPAIILFRQVDRDDNGRTSHENDYFRIKILTEEGRKYADIEIPYFKDNEKIVGGERAYHPARWLERQFRWQGLRQIYCQGKRVKVSGQDLHTP